MSELETVATRKKEAAKAAAKKKRVAKIVGGVALGAAAVVATRALKRREMIPEWMREMDPSLIPQAFEATRKKIQAIINDSLTPEEVATLLGVSVATVEQRIRTRTLYAFAHDEDLLLPRFQFRENRTVRNVEKIVPRLDRELHPISVVNWFTYPDVDLETDDASLSPVEWLEAGGDVKLLQRLAADVGSGL